MTTIVIGLGITTVIAIAVPLALLRAGIRQQERAGSLVRRPPRLSAALTRRMCGMYAESPGRAQCSASKARQAGGESSYVPDKSGSVSS
jgi:hypothetical protein